MIVFKPNGFLILGIVEKCCRDVGLSQSKYNNQVILNLLVPYVIGHYVARLRQVDVSHGLICFVGIIEGLVNKLLSIQKTKMSEASV